MRLAPLLALALLAAAPPALGKIGGSVTAVEEGGEASYRFDPATLVVPPGAEVVVFGGPAEPHTLTHDAPQGERLFDTDNVDPGANRTFVAPPEAGEYPFKCLYHPGMKGTLMVREEGVTTTSPATTPATGAPPNATTPSPTGLPGPGVPLVLAALALGGLLWRR